MTQSSLVISDGSGASVLSQLNAALQALASGNSGTAAPGVTYPLQLWADATNNLWKIRNKSNTAWITLGALDATDGLVGAFDGAKLAANSVALAKLARGTLNKVLLAQGVGADPIWGDPVFDASALVAGSVTADKLAAGIIRGKVQSIFSSARQQTAYYGMMIADGGVLKMIGQNSNGVIGYGSTNNTDAWVDARYNLPNTSGIKKVVYSQSSAWILFNDGKVYASGYNGYGQLGLGDTTARREFTRLEYFVTASVTITDCFVRSDRYSNYDGFYALGSNGILYACGLNVNGELGVGDTTNRATPTQISGAITNISKVVGAAHYTFLLTTTGALYATGYNNWGTLGLGDTTSRNAFTLVSNVAGVADVYMWDGRLDSTNWQAACSAFLRTTTGDVYSTGYNGYGTLGLGDTTNRNSFTKISTLANIVGVDTFGGSCYGPIVAWNSSGALFTWGYNGSCGAVGDGTTTQRNAPWQVVGWAENISAAPPFQGKIQQVLGFTYNFGYGSGVVLDTDGNMWGVGRDVEGQYGTGTQTNNYRFTRVRMPWMNTGEKITSMAFGGYDNYTTLYALTNQGRLFATGYNGYGQAGNLSVRSTTFLYSLQPVNF